MKEKGIFFNEEQINLLKEIRELENSEKYDQTSLDVIWRMVIADRIWSKYSMLKKDKGIFHAQLFSAMEDYLRECTKDKYELK